MSENLKDGSHATSNETGAPRATKSKGAAGHCKRFWWVYLVVLAVIIVVVVPCIILVAVPKMAQRKLNDASMHIDSIVISQSKTNSYHMAINSTISADESTHATIRGFEGTMYLMDVDPPAAFAKLQFPEVKSAAQINVNVSQEMVVEDMAALVTFNTYLVQRKTVRVKVEGDTKVRVSGIARDYPVTFTKEVELNGFDGFKGLSVSSINVKVGGDKNNFNGISHIPNPTVFTLEVGNTTWHNYFNKSEIGTLYINNLILRPGINDYYAWADIQQGPVLAGLGKKPACEDPEGMLTFELAGKTVENRGQPIPWYADALGSHNTSVTMPVGEAVAKALGGNRVPCSS